VDNCPIDLDCFFLNYVVSCVNNNYCYSLTEPWLLPYVFDPVYDPQLDKIEDFQALRVINMEDTIFMQNTLYGSEIREELKKAGWVAPIPLPYIYIKRHDFYEKHVVLGIETDYVYGCPEPFYGGFYRPCDLPYTYDVVTNSLVVIKERLWRPYYKDNDFLKAIQIPYQYNYLEEEKLGILEVIKSVKFGDLYDFHCPVALPKFKKEDFDYAHIAEIIRDEMISEPICFVKPEMNLVYEGWDGSYYCFKFDVYVYPDTDLDDVDDYERVGEIYFDDRFDFDELVIE